jgi:hypothetical protein
MKFLKNLLILTVFSSLSTVWASSFYIPLYAPAFYLVYSSTFRPQTTVYPVYNTHLPRYPLTPLTLPKNDTSFQLLHRSQPKSPIITVNSSTLLTPLQTPTGRIIPEAVSLQEYSPLELQAIQHVSQETPHFTNSSKHPSKK